MPSAHVYDMDGTVVREEQLDPYVFGAPVNTALLHQVVTAHLTNRRQGNADTKTRSEVSGGNRKPYRQKGTGRARQGSTRAPQWRGGGAVFGPQPHPYERAIPRKMKRIAIRAALSDKAANGRILLMDALTFEEPRTRDMENLLAVLPLERHVLLLMPERDENVIRSARNIHRVKLGHVASTNVVDLLKYDHVLMPVGTIEKLVTMFGEAADDTLQMKRHPRVVLRRQKRRAQAAFSGAAPAASETAASVAPAAKAKAAKAKPPATSAPSTAPTKAETAPRRRASQADQADKTSQTDQATQTGGDTAPRRRGSRSREE